MGGGKKEREREMRSPRETTGRGDDEMQGSGEKFKDLKEVERRRLGGKLPPG